MSGRAGEEGGREGEREGGIESERARGRGRGSEREKEESGAIGVEIETVGDAFSRFTNALSSCELTASRSATRERQGTFQNKTF